MTAYLLGEHLFQPLEIRRSCLQMDKNGQESTVIRILRSNLRDFLGQIFSGKCLLHRDLIPRVLQVLELDCKMRFYRNLWDVGIFKNFLEEDFLN